jgi:hypothetical protein
LSFVSIPIVWYGLLKSAVLSLPVTPPIADAEDIDPQHQSEDIFIVGMGEDSEVDVSRGVSPNVE